MIVSSEMIGFIISELTKHNQTQNVSNFTSQLKV